MCATDKIEKIRYNYIDYILHIVYALTQMTDTILELYKRIVTDCAATGTLQPEYEVWCIQYHRRNREMWSTLLQWLCTLVPDPHGWIYWYLYISSISSESDDIKYLQKSAECGHAKALATLATRDYVRTKDCTKLLELYNNGNLETAIGLYSIYLRTGQNEAATQLLTEAACKGDISCCVVSLKHGVVDDTLLRQMIRLGYHGFDHMPDIKHDNDDAAAASKLIRMGIPCGYWLRSRVNFDGTNYTHLNDLCEGKLLGCDHCEIHDTHTDAPSLEKFIHNIYGQLKTSKDQTDKLRILHSQSLESVTKSIIGEYV